MTRFLFKEPTMLRGNMRDPEFARRFIAAIGESPESTSAFSMDPEYDPPFVRLGRAVYEGFVADSGPGEFMEMHELN